MVPRPAPRPPAPREAPAGPAVAIDTLLEIFEGDVAEVACLLHAARCSLEADLARIETAAVANDRRELIDAAHRLKGTSGSTYARRVHDMGTAIERSARAGGLDAASPFVAELRIATDAAIAAIDAFASRIA